MRLLVDEHAPRSIVEALRQCGYDLIWVREQHRGMSDEDILRLSVEEQRLIVTFDKDFGELVYRRQIAHSGVLLVRIADNERCLQRLIGLLERYGESLAGSFTVLTETRVRRRRFSVIH